MCPLEQASRLNNEAAALLGSGRQLGAARLLLQALDVLKTSLWGSKCDKQIPTMSLAVATMDIARPHVGETDDTCPFNKQGPCSWDAFMYVYHRPLILPVSDSQDLFPGNRLDHYHAVRMTVLFNFALHYQLDDQATGIDLSFMQAMTRYELILMACSNRPCDALLQCLVLNNLASLHCSLCDYDACKHYMDCLAELVCETNCLDDAEGILSESELQDITLNLMISHFSPAAQAA